MTDGKMSADEHRLVAAIALARETLRDKADTAQLTAMASLGDVAHAAGQHQHAVENGEVKLGGLHQHVFKLPSAITVSVEGETGEAVSFDLPAGALLVTNVDGPHAHSSPDDTADGDSSEHRHIITLADGVDLLTATEGAHDHAVADGSTVVDGEHGHVLQLGSLSLTSVPAEGLATLQAKAGVPASPTGAPPDGRAPDATAKQAHTHSLPDGGTTGAARAGDAHVHGLPDGGQTGGPVLRGNVHVHGLPDGGQTGTPVEVDEDAAPAEAAKAAVAKAPPGMVVQSLIFDKTVFDSAEAARDWADDHGFKSDKVDETETSFRLRQRDPGDFNDATFRTIELTDGVKAVVGRLKLAKRASHAVRLLKAAETAAEERYVFGVVLVPDEPDAQGDTYSAAEVEKAAHSFLEHFGGKIKIMHKGEPVDGIVPIESYLTKVEETHGGETFPVGTWFLATRVNNDEVWAAVQSGAFTGYSMGGTALREALGPEGA